MQKKSNTAMVTLIGSIVVMIILVFGTVWMGNSARRDTEQAVRSVSLLYLDELAGDLFTGFDTSDFFDDTLDESDNSVISNNESGVIYEAVFKSESAEKIDRIREAWEKMDNE